MSASNVGTRSAALAGGVPSMKGPLPCLECGDHFTVQELEQGICATCWSALRRGWSVMDRACDELGV